VVSELLPCPFCGSREFEGDKRRLSLVSDHSHFVIYCLCGASGPVKESKEEAVAGWNTRPREEHQRVWNPFRLPRNGFSIDFKGNLKSMGIATLLQILSLENKSGILQFNRGPLRSAVCFRNGQIIAASGNEWKRLGEMILSSGLISPEKLAEALDSSKKSGKRLGEVLVARGYISHMTLKELIRQQIREAVSDLFLWVEGHFEYQDCPVEFDQQGIGEINIMELILEGARRFDEYAVEQERRAMS
jgi:Lar family restriction alleviation protein